MGAIFFRVRADVQKRWPLMVLPVLLVGIAFAAVLTLAAGAYRTSTAIGRYTEAVGGDADTVLVSQFEGRPRTEELRALPGVRELAPFTYVYARPTATLDASAELENISTFAGAGSFPGDRIVSGRLLDVNNPTEAMMHRQLATAIAAKVGTHLPISSFSVEQGATAGFGSEPAGPSFEVEVVGIFDGPSVLEDGDPTFMFSPAILAKPIAIAGTLYAIQLNGTTTTEAFAAAVDSLDTPGSFDLQKGRIISQPVHNAVNGQTQALWIITAVAAFAAIVAVGQLLARSARVGSQDRTTLSALGYTRRQITAESALRSLITASLGVVIALGAAVVASQWFPIGFVHGLEPDPGIRVEFAVLALGTIVLVGAVVAGVAVTASITRKPRAVQPTSITDALVHRLRSGPSLAGARLAVARNTGRGTSVSARLVAFGAAAAGVAAAVTFAVSLNRLVDDGARFGSNYDLAVGNAYTGASNSLSDALSGSTDIQAMMLLGSVEGRIGETTVQMVTFESIRGGLVPRVRSGRLPASSDEIGLGALEARTLKVGIGDDISFAATGGEATFRVVGFVLVPQLGVNEGVGHGGVMTADAAHRVDPTARESIAAITVRDNVPGGVVGAADRLSAAAGTIGHPSPLPAPIRNVQRVEPMPWMLAALLAALALVTFGSAVHSSLSAGRRDITTLRSLGADRRFTKRTHRWQVTWLTLLPVIVGLPFGALAGGLVFRTFATRTAAVPDPALPFLLIGLLALALLGAANLISIIPTRSGRARSVIDVMRAP